MVPALTERANGTMTFVTSHADMLIPARFLSTQEIFPDISVYLPLLLASLHV